MTRCIAAIMLTTLVAWPASAQDSTEDVVMENLRGVGALDVDQIVATYSDDAMLLTPDKVYSGHDEIRGFYEGFVAEFSKPDITMNSDGMNIAGNTAVMVWSGESPDNVYEYAADTFIVDGDKIVSHSFVGKITPK